MSDAIHSRIQRLELDSDDPAAVRPYLKNVYGADLRIEVLAHRGSGRPRLSHRRVQSDGFAVESISHDGDVETCGETSSGAVVLWTVSGRAESHARNAVAVAGPGDVILGSTGFTPVRVRTCDTRLRSAVIERKLLERVAADRGAPLHSGLSRFDGVTPINAEAALAWKRTHAYIAETVLADDVIATPLVLAAAGRLLAATALAVFPTAGVVDLNGHDESAAHPTMLRSAIGYIEAHAGEDIGVSDIAGAVYLTPRALQYMFRRHLDTTPMAYLRRVRLDQVHQELIKSSRSTTTVSSVAARWGFAHTGRFAVLYRETYGKSPHVTLRE
jgi:AraC-like DNA-binding protein